MEVERQKPERSRVLLLFGGKYENKTVIKLSDLKVNKINRASLWGRSLGFV